MDKAPFEGAVAPIALAAPNPPPPASTDPQPGAARPGATVMAASRPSIDLDEDIAALLERARVSAPVLACTRVSGNPEGN